jgi:hypothetical protein
MLQKLKLEQQQAQDTIELKILSTDMKLQPSQTAQGGSKWHGNKALNVLEKLKLKKKMKTYRQTRRHKQTRKLQGISSHLHCSPKR